MMVSGGVGAETKVEVLSTPEKMPPTLLYERFYLPDLPEKRLRHTMNRNIVCGGQETVETGTELKTCVKMNSDWGAGFKLMK